MQKRYSASLAATLVVIAWLICLVLWLIWDMLLLGSDHTGDGITTISDVFIVAKAAGLMATIAPIFFLVWVTDTYAPGFAKFLELDSLASSFYWLIATGLAAWSVIFRFTMFLADRVSRRQIGRINHERR